MQESIYTMKAVARGHPVPEGFRPPSVAGQPVRALIDVAVNAEGESPPIGESGVEADDSRIERDGGILRRLVDTAEEVEGNRGGWWTGEPPSVLFWGVLPRKRGRAPFQKGTEIGKSCFASRSPCALDRHYPKSDGGPVQDRQRGGRVESGKPPIAATTNDRRHTSASTQQSENTNL